ncbi:hypothetical protein DL98DRAFT_550048 [Cadophora sp. DSE1049]|nr:hypothetical protein DL98DRAFT_550048 [Cadophora sp. DSE1049]
MYRSAIDVDVMIHGLRELDWHAETSSQQLNASETITAFPSRARAETTKRLLAQLINEKLAALEILSDAESSGTIRARIGSKDNTKQWITCPVVDSIILNNHIRPNDLRIPVTLYSNGYEVLEDDAGAVFKFSTAWFRCDEKIKRSIVEELRNSALMLEKWMEIGAEMPVLDINSSFLEWERAVIFGHPTHPFHRTCFASSLLKPVGPQDLLRMLNPSINFFSVPRSSIHLFGPFEELNQVLLKQLAISVPPDDTNTIVPCLTQHFPALIHFFPEARLIKTIPNCAVAQAAIRTVSIPGFAYDIKLSLAYLITSALRVLPCWSAASAPSMTSLLKNLVPPELWVLGEVAAVTGSQDDDSEARYMTCILRENLETRAEEKGDVLIVVSALLEKPQQSGKTYAETLFELGTVSDKIRWFKKYIQCLLPLALDPVRRHGVGFEFHAQNTVVRVCKQTKAIKGFVIRDLAGVKMHRPTLEKQGFDVSNLDASTTDDLHELWDRVHHALLQNHIGYLLYTLGLERTHDEWGIVRSVLFEVLTADGDALGTEIYEYFVKETMAFKGFLNMRMETTLKTDQSFKIVHIQIPNVCRTKSPWLRQISVAGLQHDGRLLSPEEVTPEVRIKERAFILVNLSKTAAPYGQPTGAARRRNPHPAILPKLFIERLENFHEALALALDSIIERWWKDTDADLPTRMPLEPRTEDLLKWIDKGTGEGFIQPYKGHQGNLRPDILIPDTYDDHGLPQFRICEINGRFPISFLHNAASAYEAMTGLGLKTPLLAPATDHKKLYDSIFDLFDPAVPIYFVRETSDFPLDSPLFDLVEERTGMRPRCVAPSSLRLVPQRTSPTGFILYCTWGADQTMVRHIAMRSVNDVRSVFIAHDKRILGIIRQELYDLVHKLQILTAAQAQILEEGLIPTIIHGSPEAKALLEATSNSSATKDTYILKPFRQARGSGIELGKNLSDSEWLSILQSMQEAKVESPSAQYVLQPLLPLRTVDWFWDEDKKVRKSRMVGTYYSINGKFMGLGSWRTAAVSEDVISASTKDVTSVLSVVYLGDQ